MKIITVIGARPQFIKAAAVSREIAQHDNINEIIIHTGQHYDDNMSRIFFEQMQIPQPDHNLGINSMTHGEMTGKMLSGIERILISENPDCVLIYGDTNSTIAGALAAAKLHIKVAHVEAGLRSFNMDMPEEINRILTDKISSILFCPTETAMRNLEKEGVINSNAVSVFNCGDVMYDAALYYNNMALKPEFPIPEEFILATIHRAENTDDPERLNSIVSAFNELSDKIDIIVPLHPRTRNILTANKLETKFKIVEPVGYLQMIYLLSRSKLIMTDSGGLQKEAFFFQKPCVTLRDETEWVELIENNYNMLAGAIKERILNCVDLMGNSSLDFSKELYGDGKASNKIIKKIMELI